MRRHSPKVSAIGRNGIVYVVNYQADEVLSLNPLVGNSSEPVIPTTWWWFSVHPPLDELLSGLVCRFGLQQRRIVHSARPRLGEFLIRAENLEMVFVAGGVQLASY